MASKPAPGRDSGRMTTCPVIHSDERQEDRRDAVPTVKANEALVSPPTRGKYPDIHGLEPTEVSSVLAERLKLTSKFQAGVGSLAGGQGRNPIGEGPPSRVKLRFWLMANSRLPRRWRLAQTAPGNFAVRARPTGRLRERSWRRRTKTGSRTPASLVGNSGGMIHHGSNHGARHVGRAAQRQSVKGRNGRVCGEPVVGRTSGRPWLVCSRQARQGFGVLTRDQILTGACAVGPGWSRPPGQI